VREVEERASARKKEVERRKEKSQRRERGFEEEFSGFKQNTMWVENVSGLFRGFRVWQRSGGIAICLHCMVAWVEGTWNGLGVPM
jgi:hypothetical protein